MSLLSYNSLCLFAENGVVENCPLELVNGASIDVTLAPTILVEDRYEKLIDRKTIDYSARQPLNLHEYFMGDYEIRGMPGYILEPGEFILASTVQIFNLPADVACEYKLKSSMARCGINHLNAGWADPTWHGSALTLEIVNVSRYHRIILRPGCRIGQVVFFSCEPVDDEISYAQRGRYNNHKIVKGIQP